MVSITKQTWSVIVLGIVSGAVSFLTLFLSSITLGISGIIFGVAVIMLTSIRRCSVSCKLAWVVASWLSFLGAVWYYLINMVESPSSSLYGGAGIVGGVILLLTCRVLLGKIPISETISSLCCAFAIPAVIFVITGVERSDWFNLPPMHYFLLVMITWQTAALLFIDTLARRHAPQDVVGIPTT